MSFAHKIRVAVLRGGPSSEYEVSLKSGETVLKNLPAKYEPIDVFISREGVWHVGGMEKTPAEALKHIDVVFNALHGQFGEDGKVQRILEHLGVPFTGSKSMSSAIVMNKHLTKSSLNHLKDKIKFAAHKVFTRDEVKQKGIHEIFRTIPHPSIIKPLSAGSSVGITIVKNFLDLEKALKNALEHSDSVIVEEFIGGREVTCGVIDNFRGHKTYSLFPIEILPKSSFYDYHAKYVSEDTGFVCPANLDESTKQTIQEVSKIVHEHLGLRHYSRSDFIVHPKRGVFFLEVNTLPGMTLHSLIPKAVEASGSTISEFFDHILSMAIARK